MPVRDKGVEAQTAGVVIDAGRPMGPGVKTIADLLAEGVQACLDEVRACTERGAKAPAAAQSTTPPNRRRA